MQFNLIIRRVALSIFVTGILFFNPSCNNKEADSVAPEPDTNSSIPSPVSIGYTILNSISHDTSAFTQGLELYKGTLLESTGLEGKSSLRKINTQTGKVEKLQNMPADIFSEGLTVLNDTIYQLSWQDHLVFLYDAKSFQQLSTLPWSGEGWGITNNGKELIISEGSDKLYFVQPGNLKLNKVLSVRDNYGAVNNLNELEMVDGYIYANRWQYDYILKIDPNSGLVVGIINMQDILMKNTKSDITYLTKNGTPSQAGAVLNGIAYNKEKNTFYITGKLWPEIFEVKLN